MDINGNTNTIQLIKDHWDELIARIRQEYQISDIVYNTWFQPLSPYSVKENVVVISIASENQFFVDYITKKYTEVFQVAVGELLGRMVSVVFKLEQELEKSESTQSIQAEAEKHEINEEAYEKAGLNPKYSFENFVVGSNNNLAHASSLAVAENPGKIYNPLFLYGGAGLGKTHLMHSIGRYIIDHYSNMKVIYVTSEVFTNEVITSIRSGSDTILNQFRDKYRNVDVLMLDDVQFIIGRESTQEEFFHTFNTLHAAGKQVILSSDKAPKEMVTLDERFRSRFEWGLLADIQPPDYETRMAILKKKAELAHVNLDDTICDYVASNIKSNIRELEGAFNKIVFYSRLNKEEISQELAIKALTDIIAPKEALNMDRILTVVCNYYGVSVDAVKSKKRTKELVIPRQVFAYLAKDMTQTSVATIGRKLNKDHTTILHAISKVEKELNEDEELNHNIAVLRVKLTEG